MPAKRIQKKQEVYGLRAAHLLFFRINAEISGLRVGRGAGKVDLQEGSWLQTDGGRVAWQRVM